MPRIARSIILPLAATVCFCSTLWAAPPKRADLPADIALLVHVDVESLQAAAFGRELIDKAAGLPKVKQLMATLPEGLAFLKQVSVQDITVIGFAEKKLKGNTDEPVISVRLQADQARLLQLLSQGRDYAKLSYQGVPVHHWRPNLEAIRDVIADDQAKPEEQDEEEMPVCYLATPKEGLIVFSRSLPLLTKSLDRMQGRGEMLSQERYDAWVGDRPAWVCLGFDQTNDFPTNGMGRLFSEKDGRITIVAETTCRDQSSRLIAGAVFGALNNPEQLGKMVASMWKQDGDEDEDKKSDEPDAQTKGKKKRRGSFTFGISLDGHGGSNKIKKKDLPFVSKGIGELVANLIDCTFDDGRLALKATAFPGSWDIEMKNGKSDDLSIKLHLFSTKAKYLASQAKSDDVKRR